MHLQSFSIKNFRRLKDVHIELEPTTSIFVGANNSGKTSATHAFRLFLSDSKDKFAIHDFNAACWEQFDLFEAGKSAKGKAAPTLPTIRLDLWFKVQASDLHRVIDLLPDLDWASAPVGVRLEFAPKDPEQLLADFREAKTKALEAIKKEKDKKTDFHPWPKTLIEYLTKQLNRQYEIRYYILDHSQFDSASREKDGYIPSPLGSEARGGAQIIKSLLRVDFLDAQRHLSDAYSSSRSEDLSKRLGKFYERNLEKLETDYGAAMALATSEAQLNVHLEKVFQPTLASLNKLGYPGLADPRLVIKSALSAQSIMSDSTRVHYALNGAGTAGPDLTLPDKYNGLGYKNLIYMVVELLDFHARWLSAEEARPPLHLIMIEEPEAHLHAQIQQVFIRKVVDILQIEGDVGAPFASQLVITTHSPHIIYESGFKPIRYFRRSAMAGTAQASDVLNLSTFYGETPEETRDFLQQYMKLTHCDLFFADAAVLVEGNVERLLLPLMIEKASAPLRSNYLSILEVSGAFAHRFQTLIEFLGLVTLIITDLDSVAPKASAAAAADPDEEDAGGGAAACMTNVAGSVTSNQTLITWLPKLVKVADLLKAKEAAKTQSPSEKSPARVRVVFQTLQQVEWNGEKEDRAGRTLEEAFALENLTWVQDLAQRSLGLRVVSKKGTPTLAALAEKVYTRVRGNAFDKTAFALALMTDKSGTWKVPAYITEGLQWLQKQITVPPKAELPS